MQIPKSLGIFLGAIILTLMHWFAHWFVPMLTTNPTAPVIVAGLTVFFGYILLRYSVDNK